MGSTVSGGLVKDLDTCSSEDLFKEAEKLSPEDRAKLLKAIDAAEAKAAPDGAAWKIETPPDGGVLLCGHPGSGNVISPMLFCGAHVKDKYKFQMCDIMKGEQNSPDFLKINPFHGVPSALLSDGTALYESSAMLRHLARKFAPDTYAADKAWEIDACMDKRQLDLYKAWSPFGYYAMQIISSPPPKDAALKLNDVLSNMEKAFLKGKFVGGDKLCIADYSILPLLNTLTLPTVKKIGYTLPDRWTTYLNDAKEALGDAWTEGVKVHEGWVSSNEGAVQAVEFDKAQDAIGGSEWKSEAVPDGGFACYAHPLSANAVPIMLFGGKHCKDKFKFQTCDIMKGEQFSKDFLDMNPFHQIPTVKTSDGASIYEHGAVLRYLALKHAPETYPEDRRLAIDIIMDKRQMDLYKAWSPIGYYAMGFGAKPDKSASAKLDEVLNLMDKAFMKEKFIGGDKLCIADYSLAPMINTLQLEAVKKQGYKLPERWAKYLADVKAEAGEAWAEAVKAHEGHVDGKENVERVEKIFD